MIWLISAGRTAGGGPVLALAAGEGVVADTVAAGGGLVLGGDDAHVVDPGRRRRRGGGLRFRLGMGVAADLLRDGQPGRGAVPADLDDGQVERVEDALDFPPGQLRA